jgi:CPA1 family monovalent cation:H+ antiporter
MTPGSTIEFLVWLLIAASIIAVIAARLRIPYTVALVVGGLVLGSFHLPVLQSLFAHSPDWLTPDVSLIIFLPPSCLREASRSSCANCGKVSFRSVCWLPWVF